MKTVIFTSGYYDGDDELSSIKGHRSDVLFRDDDGLYYTLELQLTSTVIYLSLGYEANVYETMHYQFTPENDPRLTPGIATHYSLYLNGTAPHRVPI